MNSKNIYLFLLPWLLLPGFVSGQTQIINKPDTSRRYGIYGVTAYYSGNGQPNVSQQSFISSDLQSMLKLIDSSRNGAIVTIDDLRFIDSNGRSQPINDIAYNFNNGKIFYPYASHGELNFATIKTLDFISGVIYFAGVGFQNSMAINAGDSNLLQKCFEKSTSGTTITFEGCVYKNKNGVSSIVSKSIRL